MHDDVLERVRSEAGRITAPQGDLPVVVRRATLLRARRWTAGALAVAVIATGVILPLVVLSRVRPREPVPRSSGTTPAAPALTFAPAAGWNVRVTDPSLAGLPGAPQAWTANVPFAETEVSPGVMQSYPGSDPTETIDSLPPGGIVIMVGVPIQTRNPLPESRNFPHRELPLGIEYGPSSSWEGQPRDDLSLAGVNAEVNGWWISVRVIFGTKDPGDDLMREADEELARLDLPPARATTEAWDDFGISMERPDGWYGTLTQWAPGGEPILQASTVPIDDLHDGSSARKALGAGDLFIVLAENPAVAAHYEELTFPIAVGLEDACPTCEILDDGTSPPPDHTLLYRSFASGGREFDLFVEFGTADVTPEQLKRVNDVLATLRTQPGPTPTASPTEGSAWPEPGFRASVPSGWTEEIEPVPAGAEARVVVAWGTWSFRIGGGCGPEPALAALPDDGAFVWVIEHRSPDNSGDFVGPPPKFRMDLQVPPARWTCAASAPSRQYLFRIGGRYFEVHVALGTRAPSTTVTDVEELISSIEVDPAS